MKKTLYALLLMVSAFSFSSCRDEDNLPYPKTEEVPVIFTNITAGQSSFKLSDIAGTGNPTATFSIDVKGGETSNIESIEVYRSFRGYNVPPVTTPVTDPTLGLGPRLLLRTVAPNSGNIDVTLNEVIAGLTRAAGNSQAGTRVALTRASLKENEGFLFSYELVMKDGRRVVYTPLSGGVISGAQASAPYTGVVTVVK